MSWLTKASEKIKKAFSKKDTGKSKQKCPLLETGLLVAVVRGDNRRVVKDTDVIIDGASGTNKKTDKDGLALFKPIEPDTYKINVTLPGHMADSFEKPEQEQETVSLGSCPIHVIKVLPLSTLKVRVLRKEGEKEKFLEGVKIHIKGRDERDGQTPEIRDGWLAFEKIKSGDYEISITSLGTYAKVYKIPAISGTRISAGETKEVIFYVKKAILKIKIVDKNDEKRFIPKVKVKIDVLAQGNALSEKTTTENEPVVHDPVEPGKYSVTISFSKEDEERYRIPDDEQKTKEVTIESGSTYELVFRVIPVVRVYLKLQFKDPEGKDRIFPEKMPLQLVFDGDEHLDAVVGKDGLVYDKEGDDAKPYVEVERRRKWFKLAFKQPKRAFVVCEEKGKKETQEYLQEEDPFKADTDLRKAINQKKRVFQLPHGDFTWDNADWEISGANTFKDHKVDKIDDIKTDVGKKDSPATVSLDLHWQFIRFEYFDRYYGQSDHNNKKISILPVPLEGYGENVKSQATPPVDKLTTFSNWNIGDDDTKLVQCLPWIIRRKNDDKSIGYPGRDSMLRFQTDDDHRFIKSTAKDSREFTKLDDTNPDQHHLPCADRLRYYDLPKEWRSTRYFCRLSNNADDQDFFEAIYHRGFDNGHPLIFSLDDMILTDENLATVAWRYNDPEQDPPNDRLALFINTFKGSAWNVPEPPAPAAPAKAPPPAPLPEFPKTHSAHGKPKPPPIPPRSMALPAKPAGPSLTTWYSPDGLYRHDLKNNACFNSRLIVKTNYLADYPNWTRIIIAKNNPFDVFDKRIEFDSTRTDDVVGARAAVRCVDVSPGTGVGTAPGANLPNRPALVPNNADHPFFAIKPFTEQVYYSYTYTRAGAGTDDEWSAPLADNDVGLFKIGRYDMLHLRCCNFNGDKEVACVFRHHRFSFNFNEITLDANPIDNKLKDGSFANTDAGRIQRDNARNLWTSNLAHRTMDRWNGNEAPYSGEIGWVIPQDATANKIYNKVITYLQVSDQQHAHFHLTYTDNKGSYVTPHGTGVLEEVDNTIQGNGRLDGCHETGHTGGHPDDYIHQEAHAYGQNGFGSYQMPGAPYQLDPNALMKGSLHIRSRYFWHIAEWMRTLPGFNNVDFEVKRGNDAPAGDAYKLPHYPSPRIGRHFVCWPIKGIRRHSTGTCLYDSYLYMIGEDQFSTAVLPGNLGGGNKFDGVLVVVVKCMLRQATWWHTDAANQAMIKRRLFAKMNQEVDTALNNKVTAVFKCSNNAGEKRTFNRCLLHFSPRFDDRPNIGAGEHVDVELREHDPLEANQTDFGADPKTIRVDIRTLATLLGLPNPDNELQADIDRVAAEYKNAFLNAIGLSSNNADANYYGNANAYNNIFSTAGAVADLAVTRI